MEDNLQMCLSNADQLQPHGTTLAKRSHLTRRSLPANITENWKRKRAGSFPSIDEEYLLGCSGCDFVEAVLSAASRADFR
jgi:hypothetical protein